MFVSSKLQLSYSWEILLKTIDRDVVVLKDNCKEIRTFTPRK